MNVKAILTVTLLTILSMGILSQPLFAASNAEGREEEVEKGPNNGRMLRDNDFAIELAIFEDGVPPEFRIFATDGSSKIDPKDLTVKVNLVRLGNVVDNINFFVENDYLRGDMEIYEPHSFRVVVKAKYRGKLYSWDYDNYEGRISLTSDMANSMEIGTEVVTNQTLEEKIQVYGKLALPASASRHISARFPGEIKSLNVALGQRVKKGDLLMTIEGNESLRAYQVRSPIDGVITQQDAGVGEQTGERNLLAISDTSKLIAELSVFPKDQAKVVVGATVKIEIPGTTETQVTKVYDYLTNVNHLQARRYRAMMDNSSGQLSIGQFVTAEILVERYRVAMAVKRIGLQAFRDFTVVYTKIDDQYEVRMLELGRKAGPWVEVLGGITPGSEYVTENSYIIKADIDKSGASHDH